MTNTINFPLLRDYDSGSSSSLGSSCSASVRGEAELSKVEALPLYSAIGKACFACIRPSPELLTDDTSTAFEQTQQIDGTGWTFPNQTDPQSNATLSTNLKMFSLGELESATQNFCADNALGEGIYGSLFRGWIHQEKLIATNPGQGIAVAVKRFKQGLQWDQKWLEEMKDLGQLDHPNLVKVVGYCFKDDHRLLVSEFMPRGSLKCCLFSMDSELQPLSWSLRMKVALDAAKGLAFLHNAKYQVIHGDFKPSNILLDSKYNAKLSDFGLAKFNPDPYELETVYGPRQFGNAFVSEYSAPECYHTGYLTTKSDVYSFGVVLLEMLLGPQVAEKKKCSGVEFAYVDRAKLCLYDTRKRLSIDTRLDGQYSLKDANKAAQLALRCLNIHRWDKPTMDEVVAVLETIQSNT